MSFCFVLSQEYPPGVMTVPMRSRTLKPFKTTNLVVFAPENGSGDHHETHFVAYGDALIVDPGCHSKLHAEVCHWQCVVFTIFFFFYTVWYRDIFSPYSNIWSVRLCFKTIHDCLVFS